ncbi:hypothetical protein A0H81_05158 [Grifola frondosa]|uniref:Uncharacterized protein n=1 Tax=Grifola frondosa TaxID=5627 RepID=A0A1C7MCH4_GRIFR|nr:hypothetical protein A0H81_05158 [Grifola frondosa]
MPSRTIVIWHSPNCASSFPVLTVMALILSPVVSGIVADIPTLIERTLKYEIECQTLGLLCDDLENQIERLKDRVNDERWKQDLLREEIAVIVRKRIGLSEPTAIPKPAEIFTFEFPHPVTARTRRSHRPKTVPQPAMSVKSKRKGVIFADEVRITKRAKLDFEEGSLLARLDCRDIFF